MHEYGYHPIIVTRNWDIKIEKPEDVLKSTGEKVVHEVNDFYEVYYLPYKASFRDRFFTRFEGSPLQKLSRIFTFFELIAENFTTRFQSDRMIYTFSKKLIKENQEIKKIIISGNPFNEFYFGFKLQKKFNIKWVADYRDDWNTTELDTGSSGAHSFIKKLQQKSEKQWVGTASYITSVSPYYVDKISKYVNRPGKVILNGFDFEKPESSHKNRNEFIITYNGSLYSTQPVEVFLECIDRIIKNKEYGIDIKIQFPGLAFDPIQKKRVEEAFPDLIENITITNRIPKGDVISLQMNSDLLLMLAHSNTKGIPSSKLYEYIGLQKPVLLYPSDNDILEETLKDTGTGLICNTPEELERTICDAIENKIKGVGILPKPDSKNILFYSRKNQAGSLAKLLDVI